MKICLMNNLYPPHQRGGAEIVVKQAIDNLRQKNHQVFLITTRPGTTGLTTEHGLKIYFLKSRYYNLSKLPVPLKMFWHMANIFSFSKARRIKKILLTEKPDLIISHNLMGLGFWVARTINKLEIEHHHFLHDIQLLHPSGLMFYGREKKINSVLSKIYQAINRSIFSGVKKVISPSQWLLNEHNKRNFFLGAEKQIIPFQPTHFPTTETLNKPSHSSAFVFVGQIEKHKGVQLLINSFKQVADPTIRLIIVGDGQELVTMKKLANNDARIKFTGRKEGSELRQIISESKYLVVPSLCYENSPTIIHQAHGLGIPVIAANIGGIPEIINEGDTLFQANDQEDLRKKIIEAK